MDTGIFGKVVKFVYVNLIICLMVFSDPVVPSSNIVKSLPGFPGPLPFNLETGYIALDEKEDKQIFYYFVESQGSPRDDPLILWFTGGPGCSGLCALAFVIGPIRFGANSEDKDGSLPTLELNPDSWTKAASIIFIDAPIGSGFSYSRSWQGYQTGDNVFADQGFIFLKKWLVAHPEFSSNRLYVGGDSYAGLIVPMVAQEIAKSIETNRSQDLNFQGYLVGNPVTNIALDSNSKISFAHRMALISDELYESVKKTCKGQYQGNHSSNEPCANDLNAISLCIEDINIYHILDPKCRSIFSANGKMKESNKKSILEMPYDHSKSVKPHLSSGGPPSRISDFGCLSLTLIHFWANDKAVQRALHIKEGTIKTWVRCPQNLAYKRDVDNVVSYHQHLNSQGYRALIYSGDHDIVVPYIGTQAWIKSLNLPIADKWRPWLVDDQIAGYVTKYSDKLTFATVKGGGHTAPQYKPKECFAMFKRWISQEPL